MVEGMAVRIAALEYLADSLKPIDTPGTYIMMMVLGMVFVPFYVKMVQAHLKNPEDYYAMSFEKKFFIGLLAIAFLIGFGLVNYLRFVQAG